MGITDVYVWASPQLPDAEWADMNRRVDGVRVFANTNLAGRAAAGGFDGLYTYDVLLFGGALFHASATRRAASTSSARRPSARATTRGTPPATSGSSRARTAR